MLTNLKKRSIPHILLNARITKKSFKRWKFLGNFSKNLFKNFEITYPQNRETFRFLKILGTKKIKFLGNLKFSENEFDLNHKINNELNLFLNNRLHWCASSTHNSEEILCANTHIKLQKKFKNLLTIIIPRHIHRADEITHSIKTLGLKIHRHSWGSKINKNSQIYLVDTYGETKSFFKESKVVFLGGSMIKHGGQNPLEAARYGCKILHGPHVYNFKEVYELLNKNNFSSKINNSNDLKENIELLIKKKINSKNLIKKIKVLGDNILTLTINELNFLIEKNENKKT